MLKQLEIENFVFFKKATLNFHQGFNVFTGETGAGKTIFLNALNLTLGEKVSKKVIRAGEKRVKVTSTFDIQKKENIKKKIAALEIEVEDELILQREVSNDGKSKAKINGQLVTLPDLKTIAKLLIDIHSQHENQNLLNPHFHLLFLDKITGLDNDLLQYKRKYFQWKEKFKVLEDTVEREQAAKQEADFLEFTLKELKSIVPQVEYDELKTKLKELEDQQKVTECFYQIHQLINDGVMTGLEKSIHLLKKLIEKNEVVDKKISLSLKKFGDSLNDIEAVKEDLIDNFDLGKDYNHQIDQINEKLSITESKIKKYGLPIDKLFEKRTNAEEKLSFLNNADFEKKELEKIITQLTQDLLKEGIKLHEKRLAGKLHLEERINKEFKYLGMEQASFVIGLKQIDLSLADISKSIETLSLEDLMKKYSFKESGISDAEFLYSPAQEVKAKSLKKIASGGELSRIMLAIKTVFSEKFSNQTIVFDEIDTGVGGETAIHIGDKIKEISKKKQVIVITHLPQIAKFANQHFVIEKSLDKKGLTNSKISKLDKKNITAEFARMLGKKANAQSLKLAEEFLKEK